MKITQVITTYNRGHLLDHSLRRLCTLTPPDELLVIDDGGEDATEEVCARWGEHLPIRYIYNHNPGPSICSMARNIGVKEASHEMIVTSEPELIFLTDLIAQFKQLHVEHPTQVISSGRVWFAPEGYHGDEINPGWEEAGDYIPPIGSQDAIGWVAPYAALWSRRWLADLGGWDESFPGYWGWDDIDLLTRLRIAGYGQHIALDCMAIHQFHGLGGDVGFINEKHFLAKSFNQGDENDHADLIANRGKEWGTITPCS